MPSPLVSIIMPVYNSEKYIKDSISSALQQSYENYELIIVDDCSTDMSRNIINTFQNKDKRITCIFLSENKGVAHARNQGIQAAKGKYIAFMDSDDLWDADKLKTQVEIMEDSNADLSYTSYMMIDEQGIIFSKKNVPQTVDFTDLLKENFICLSSILVKSCVAKKHFMKREYFHEDYIFLLDLLKENCFFKGIEKNLVYYRVSRLGRSMNKKNAAKFRWKIYRDYLGMNWLISSYYFFYYFINGIRKYYFKSKEA